MGRPRLKVNAPSTTKRILDAAEKAFGEKGYDGARLEDIARSVGISRPSLLYHYGSKRRLYSAVVSNVFEQLELMLADIISTDGSFTEQIISVVRAFQSFLTERPHVARLILREILDDKGPGHQLIIQAGVPILNMVQRFMRERGRGVVRENLPIRAAIMQLVAGAFVHSAAGPLREPLWGRADHAEELARMLFLQEAHA